MSEPNDIPMAVNVWLKSSAHPRAASYTNVGVAQGRTYLDFGFIKPALLAIAKTAMMLKRQQWVWTGILFLGCDGHECIGMVP